MSCLGAAWRDWAVCPGGLGWEKRVLLAQPPTPGPPVQPKCKEPGVPGGSGAELQMSGPAWPLSAHVMH